MFYRGNRYLEMNIKIMKFLTDGGADVNVGVKYHNNNTILTFVCKLEQNELVKILVEASSDINHENKYGCTH